MLAVAVRADGRSGDTCPKGRAVDAGRVFLRHPVVAHATGFRNGCAELNCARPLDLVHAAVAHGAIGTGLVALCPGLAMHADGVPARHNGVALSAGGFGDSTGVRVFFVFRMATRAADAGVHAARDFLPEIVTRGARGLILRHKRSGNRQGPEDQTASAEEVEESRRQ